MQPELKQRWIEALRSGGYRQGKNYLKRAVKDEDQYCCLGVLCDLIDPQVWGSKSSVFDPANIKIYAWRNTHVTLPPQQLQEELAIPDFMRYASMNDQGASFEEIANSIEMEL